MPNRRWQRPNQRRRRPIPTCRWRCPRPTRPLAEMRHGNILWAFFRLLELAMPLFFLFTGLGTRLRRMCEHISGGRWFWTVTLFACTHLALAALITLPFDFYFGYVQQHAAGKSNRTLPSWVTGERRPTYRQIGRRIVVNLASLSIDRQKPAPLVLLLRPCADSVCLSCFSRFAGVGRLGRWTIRRFSGRLGVLRTARPGVTTADCVYVRFPLACHFAVFQFVCPPYRARSRPLWP
jgi:hypothetical protein